MAYYKDAKAGIWWKSLIAALQCRGWLIAENELEGVTAAIHNGWYITRRVAVPAIKKAIAENKGTATVKVCSRKHYDYIELSTEDPETAASVLHQQLDSRPV